MAINLAEKYAPALAQAYTRASVIQDKVSKDYEWNGVATIHILTATTQDLNDYVRSGTNRYGAPTELADTKQDLLITQDKSFAITVDRGNYDDQMMAKKTGEVTKAEINEKVVPFFDSYALKAWVTAAGTTLSQAAVTSDTVLDMFIAARKILVDNNFPMAAGMNYAYLSTTTFSKLLRNPEFIKNDVLGQKVLANGVVGQCMGIPVVEIPDSYFAAGTQALFAHKKSVLAPSKLNELKIHNDAPGISGTLMEGRYRGDAFVLNALKMGVVAVKVGA